MNHGLNRFSAILLLTLTPLLASASWVDDTLKRQREIDINAPLNEASFIGTHNSYNSKAYQIPLVRYIDPNHTLTIYDQLDAGVRSVELDAHWTLGSHFKKEILLCHGQPTHLGCSAFDRPIEEGLTEIRNWLQKHPGEIVLLYIERHLDGHEPRMAALMDKYLGQYLFQPKLVRKSNDERACVSLPQTLTKADILRAGKQLLLIVKHCDGSNPNYEEQNEFPFVWNDYAFSGSGEMQPQVYTFIDADMSQITYPSCGKYDLYKNDPLHTSLWRILEDRTLLSSVVHPSKKMETEEMRDLIRCGINWPSMDMLEKNDPRFVGAIWTFAQDYPKTGNGACAWYQTGTGMINADCAKTAESFSCQNESTRAFGLTHEGGTFTEGENACKALGMEWHFKTPVNGGQMNTLKELAQAGSIRSVWVNYQENSSGTWVANQ